MSQLESETETVPFPSMVGVNSEIDAIDRILKAKKEELLQLNIQQHQMVDSMTSERNRHEQMLVQDKQDGRLKLKARMKEIDKLKAETETEKRKISDSYYRQKEAENLAQRGAALVMQQERALADLNKERMEIASIRRNVEGMRDQVDSKANAAAHDMSIAKKLSNEAKSVMEQVELRTADLGRQDDDLKVREKNLEVQTKHYETIKVEVESQLEKLTNYKPDESQPQEQKVVEPVTPAEPVKASQTAKVGGKGKTSKLIKAISEKKKESINA